MLTFVAKIVRWLLGRLLTASLIVVLIVAATAAGLYARGLWKERDALVEKLKTELQKQEEVGKRLAAEKDKLQENFNDELTKLKGNISNIETRISEGVSRISDAKAKWDDAEAKLKKYRSLWKNLLIKMGIDAATDDLKKLESARDASARAHDTANAKQTEETKEQLRLGKEKEELEASREKALKKADEKIKKNSTGSDQTRNALHDAESRRKELDDTQAAALLWLRKGWDASVWIVVTALSAIFLLPTVWNVCAYYGWARAAEYAAPVRLHPEGGPAVSASESRPAQRIHLESGEIALVKERFLQSSDEPLRKRTQLVLSWRYLITSLATEFYLLSRIEGVRSDGAMELILSEQLDGLTELAVVEIPKGGALACRPSFIAAMIYPQDQPPQIRSHWRWLFLHAWITLQFRHFVFHGPVKLLLAAPRGVQVEELDRREGVGRRTNQDAIIGFEPGMAYTSRRAETFLAYWRGVNPLFDDYFSGRGKLLSQQVIGIPQRAGVRKLWSSLTSVVGKLLGF